MEAFYCRLRDEKSESGYKDGFVGIANDLQMVMQPEANSPAGVIQLPKVAVLWFKQSSDGLIPSAQPSPSFHNPQELQAIGMYNGQDWDEDIEEEIEEEESSLEIEQALNAGTVIEDTEHNSAIEHPHIVPVAPPQEAPTPQVIDDTVSAAVPTQAAPTPEPTLKAVPRGSTPRVYAARPKAPMGLPTHLRPR